MWKRMIRFIAKQAKSPGGQIYARQVLRTVARLEEEVVALRQDIERVNRNEEIDGLKRRMDTVEANFVRWIQEEAASNERGMDNKR